MLPWLPPPGVVLTETRLSSKGHVVAGDKYRFRAGRPEKIGGWAKHATSAFTGVARCLHSWGDNSGRQLIGIGTSGKIQVYDGSSYIDITPYAIYSAFYQVSGAHAVLSGIFDTTSGSKTVTVNYVGHGVSELGYVYFHGAAAGGGITIDGTYQVTSITSSSKFTILHSIAASSSVNSTGGAAIEFAFELSPGNQDQVLSYGFGAGFFGAETFGSQRTSSIVLGARVPFLDNFGEDLLVQISGGSLYYWDRSAGGRAFLATNAPTPNNAMFLTEEGVVMALGASGDPLNILWSDLFNYNVWTALATNSAGSKKVAGGSRLVGGLRGQRGGGVIFTDDEAFPYRFVTTDVVYEIASAGAQAGLIGPNAAATSNGVVYWCSNNVFYLYDGAVKEIPNQDSIQRYWFDGINRQQPDKVFCGVNVDFGEIWFFAAFADALEPDHYLIYSTSQQVWAHGTLVRTAWEKTTAASNHYPIASSDASFLYAHEFGVDDDGSAIYSWIQTGPMAGKNGQVLLDLWGIVPDIEDHVGRIDLSAITQEYPNSDEVTEGPYPMFNDSGRVDTHSQGRLLGFLLESNVVGGDWRLGQMQLDVSVAGERP